MVGDVVTNASYVGWARNKHDRTPLLYETFWDEGCVYYVRTTQPQTIMHLETNSNLYGRTVNPYNRNLTPGGSSGGESALLGMRGSVLVRIDHYYPNCGYVGILTATGYWRRYWRKRSLPSGSCWSIRLEVGPA